MGGLMDTFINNIDSQILEIKKLAKVSRWQNRAIGFLLGIAVMQALRLLGVWGD